MRVFVLLPFLGLLKGCDAIIGCDIASSACPASADVVQCDNSNNFNAMYKMALEPRTWTQENMNKFCLESHKDTFVNYVTCLIASEHKCVGAANTNLVMSVEVIGDYHQFACQEHNRSAVVGTCVTQNKDAIGTCVSTAVSSFTTSMPKYQCLYLNELRDCYTKNMDGCSEHTKNVIAILLFKMRPRTCGSEIIQSSLLLLIMATVASFLTKRS